MKPVQLDQDKLYHIPGETEFTGAISAEVSDKQPKRYQHDSLPTVMFGDRKVASLGEPTEWIRVKIAGTNDVYLTPAYRAKK